VPDDLLAEAVAELYGAAPEAFTGRRAALAAAAKESGDRSVAKAIGALRRPTRAAWVVNQLARADPGAPLRLAELGGALRAAQQAGHGPRLRELSAARGALVDALTGQALALAGVPDPPPALRLEVAETLSAALADPAVAADFSAGRLVRAAQWSGFGVLPEGSLPEGRVPAARRGPGKAAPAKVGSPAEAEERSARRLEQRAEGEQALAAASAATAEAEAEEDRLEAGVRDLEQQLVQARSDLSAARMRARHAEAAERRARQALDRP
jgi:hypothetical protein